MKSLFYSILLISLISPVVNAQKLASEKIYKIVSDSVVSISDLDSQGSGVVLTADGYILTNYHVVASGLAFSVKVIVQEGGRQVERTFKACSERGFFSLER